MGQVSPISISAAGGSTAPIARSPRTRHSDSAGVGVMEGADRAPSAGCSRGMRGVVITSGVAYGDGGGGVPGVLLGSPRDPAGNLIMLGTGKRRW